MSDVDQDVHSEFDNMITVQLARKEARIAQLEAELQRMSAEQASRRNSHETQPAPALIIPPSVSWKKSPATRLTEEAGTIAIPGKDMPVADDRPISLSTLEEPPQTTVALPQESVTVRNEASPPLVPPASPYGWSDPVIRQHFGMKPYQKLLLIGAASLFSVLVMGLMIHGMLDSGLDYRAHPLQQGNVLESKVTEAPLQSAAVTTPQAVHETQNLTPTQGPIIDPPPIETSPPTRVAPKARVPLSAHTDRGFHSIASDKPHAELSPRKAPTLPHPQAASADTGEKRRLRAHRQPVTPRDPYDTADDPYDRSYDSGYDRGNEDFGRRHRRRGPGWDERSDRWIDRLPR